MASGNRGKLAELRRLLAGIPIRVLSPAEAGSPLPPVDEDGLTFEANAVKKALAAASVCDRGVLVLADDSGLEVDALQGAPGVRSARFAGFQGHPAQRDTANNQHLLHSLAGVPLERRSARFVCVLALAKAGQVLAITHGQVKGVILDRPRGKGGFGYDPLFLHPPTGRTFAQMSPTEKQAVSHRGRALADLRSILAGLPLDD
jgi:XTP/dITP diphosphohydrolase